MDDKPEQRKRRADSTLAAWDASIDPEMLARLAGLQERRGFLSGALKSTAFLTSLPLWGALQGCDRAADSQALLQQEPWQTFAAVQQQLFPDDGNGPSARDIHATVYLKFVIDAPDTDAGDKTFILNGIKWLNGLSDTQFGKSFIALNSLDRHSVLKRVAGSSAGERWLSHLLLYIMEALLTDPVYGGNPAGIGWQWLEYQPGFPRPPKDKRYTQLL